MLESLVQRLSRSSSPHMPIWLGRASRAHLYFRQSSTTARKVMDVFGPADLKKGVSGQEQEEGNVRLVERTLQWKPLEFPAARLSVPAADLFAAASDPLEHSADDIGRYFQLDGSSSAFADVFYHTGFCGDEREFRQLRTAALMVRQPGLALRDELLALQQAGALADAAGFIINGPRGCGKSYTLNYVIAACHQAGWLVVNLPRASDWTFGLGARSDAESASQWEPKGRPSRAQGWLAAAYASFDNQSTLSASEAYRVTDGEFFKEMPSELKASPLMSELYESPDASINLLLSVYLSQKSKLTAIAIKDPERREHYSWAAKDPLMGPTLADMLALVCHDRYNSFNDFPVPLRPIWDFLHELQTVTEYPVLLVVDGWNYWQHITNAKHWHSQVPLHAQEMLVPHLLGDIVKFGGSMRNGVMLCGITHSGATRPSLPRWMRKHYKPPIDWRYPVLEGRSEALAPLVRNVPPYTPRELQKCLEFYGFTGHLMNAGLQDQLRSGALRRKVSLLSGGVGEDVFKLCRAM